MDSQPWPRLLARWQDGRLCTLLLHADGRRAYLREEPAADAAQLAPALADALAAMHRPVRHAALLTDTEMATDDLRRRLGLATLCSVSLARAQRLVPEDADGWDGAAHALDLALHAPGTGAVCAQIRATYPHLTRSERRVADVVLANPAAVMETATARLAEAAQVSQPQVIRFCRALGFDGVKSLKRALTASLARGAEGFTGHPLLARSLNALQHVDRYLLATAARLLQQARQIDVLADTARAPLVDLALTTLWRLGLHARAVPVGGHSTAPVCLSLGANAITAGVLITEDHQPDSTALQLVTGPELHAAPTLLAMLMLQLLLAETAVPMPAPSSRSTLETPRSAPSRAQP